MHINSYGLIVNTLFQRGVEKYNEGDFEGAIENFKLALKDETIVKSYQALASLNIAVIKILGITEETDPLEVIEYIENGEILGDPVSSFLISTLTQIQEPFDFVDIEDILMKKIGVDVTSYNLLLAFVIIIGSIDKLSHLEKECLSGFLCVFAEESKSTSNVFLKNFINYYIPEEFRNKTVNIDAFTEYLLNTVSNINEYLMASGHELDNVLYINMLALAYILNKYSDGKYHVKLASIETIHSMLNKQVIEDSIREILCGNNAPTIIQSQEEKTLVKTEEDEPLKPIIGVGELAQYFKDNEITRFNCNNDCNDECNDFNDCIKTCILQCENTIFNIVDSTHWEQVLVDEIKEIKKVLPETELVVLSNCDPIYVEFEDEVLSNLSIDRIIRKPGASYRDLLVEFLNSSSCDLEKTCLVGPDEESIRLAYEFGLLAVLQKTKWISKNKYALSYHADFEYSKTYRLLEFLKDPHCFKPILEQLIEKEDEPKYKNYIRTQRFPSLESYRKPVTIYGLGRHFAGYRSLSARGDRHLLTQSIHNNKDTKEFPESWVKAIENFIRFKKLGIDRPLLLLSIPARPGRTDRLSYLIQQVVEYSGTNDLRLMTQPGVLYYLDGVKSNSHEFLNREERYRNIRDHLMIDMNPMLDVIIEYDRPEILIIDDVATSGASFFYAKKKLLEAGFDSVYCLAIGINISK